ncbi:MAG TPA: hypothetical protein VIH59_31650 [Candidatus Tectomicrobia bacterium]|jgi:hypothetical protein
MVHQWIPILGIVIVLTIGGWGETPMQSTWAASEGSEGGQSRSDKDKGRGETLDDLLAEVATRVPAFGGMFIGPDGTMYLDLLDRRLEEAALEAIAAVFGPERLAQGSVQALSERRAPGSIQILPGQYSFLQLKTWHEDMRTEVLGLPGVILTDIDEGENRLRIGVEAQELQGAVEAQLASLGIPPAAVIIEETEPIAFVSHTLRSRVRPLVGGLQINFPGFLCSLGFIVIRAGVQGMVTNSHCTSIQGGVTGTVYHQPSTSGTMNRIGLETVDPPYFTGGACPAGRRCRYSDSAFIRVPHLAGPSVTIRRGKIARPLGLGSLTISHTAPTLRIVGETPFALAGEKVHKVGRTTGRTQGVVSATCVNTNVLGTDITLLCQDFVHAGVAPGDSGSPVFRITNTPAAGDVRLYGVLWGGNSSGTQFVYSAIGSFNMQRPTELGLLTTCAPGFSC